MRAIIVNLVAEMGLNMFLIFNISKINSMSFNDDFLPKNLFSTKFCFLGGEKIHNFGCAVQTHVTPVLLRFCIECFREG